MYLIAQRFITIFTVSISLVIFNSLVLHSQSDHYWSQSFNTESSLVAGAVVGGDAGPSAIYYNPSLIVKDGSHQLAFSANLISFQTINLENLAGEGTNYNNFTLQIQPKFLSYIGGSKRNKKIVYQFAFLVPLTTNVKFNYDYQNRLDIIKRMDEEEDYLGGISFLKQYDDFYIGGGMAYHLSDRFSLGFSAFVSVKVLDYKTRLATKAFQETDTVLINGEPEPVYFAESTFIENLNYWDISLLFKLGLQYRSPNMNWRLGLNITTPNLGIYGEGDVKKELYRSNVFDDENGIFTSNLTFYALQENIRTKIKDPLSIAIGLEYLTPNRKNAILFTTEYFFSIEPYSILETNNNESIGNFQVDDIASTMNFYTKAKSILNVGLGFVQYINERLTINGGFKTDFNNLSGSGRKTFENNLYRSLLNDIYFDKFHFIAGMRMDVQKFGFVAGIQYTWGRENNMYNLVNFSEPVEYDTTTGLSLQGERQENMKVRYNEISLFFGITYGFGK